MSDAHITQHIRQNLAAVEDRIVSACEQSGRSRDDVQLIAITKYAEWPWVEALLEEGQTHVGESRPQQLTDRHELLASRRDVCWHLIGHLQRNKVRPMLTRVSRIHSVDSWKLLDRIEFIAEELHIQPKVLLEINLSGEVAKDGFSLKELLSDAERLTQFSHLKITGLMTMAPHSDEETLVRPVFAQLRKFRDDLETEYAGELSLPELSMGMSGDFEWAIAEGATHIRIGSRLFQGLS